MKKESTEEVAAETIAPVAVAPVAVAPITAEVGGDATDDMIADIEDEKDAEHKGALAGTTQVAQQKELADNGFGGDEQSPNEQ
jgi:hypothetical protein